MQPDYFSPSVLLSTKPMSKLLAEILFIPDFEDSRIPISLHRLLEKEFLQDFDQELRWASMSGRFKGELFQSLILSIDKPKGTVRRVVFLGAGKKKSMSVDRWRRLMSTAVMISRKARHAKVAFLCDGAGERVVQALVEGAYLGNFDSGSYKTNKKDSSWVESIELVVKRKSKSGIKPLIAGKARGCVFGEYTNIARSLVNEPSNILTPRTLANRAEKYGLGAGLEVDVLDEDQIRDLGMGLVLGVAQGSSEPPRVIVMKHNPPGIRGGPVLGFVGKGVTFDTGGISIKPANNMDKMKGDMAGAAAVIGAMCILSKLKAPVRAIGIIPVAENMPGANALNPGDVLKSASGKTVEVLNTDAEGRLLLGDGIWYAQKLGATHLVDIATLTGACVVALGNTTSGLFGTPSWWVDQIELASARAGDRSWQLPVFEDYSEALKSEIADFANIGGREAGAITAALFVKEFVNELPWGHLDIAGTSWAEEQQPYQLKGATGTAVRTLAELALDVRSWKKLK